MSFFRNKRRENVSGQHERPVSSAPNQKDPLEAFLEETCGLSLDELEVFALRWEDSAREKDPRA